MFEKEAEEYEERKHCRYEDNDYCGDIADGIIQAFQNGAEYGYNKALEDTETMLKVLKDRGVISSWYYNGSYHVGNKLPR